MIGMACVVILTLTFVCLVSAFIIEFGYALEEIWLLSITSVW